jgi:hypothetical protein
MNRKTVALGLALTLLGAATALAPSAGAGDAVAESATGSGQFMTSAGMRTFAFTALRASDGTVQGEAQVRNPVLGTLRHFQIDCLSVRNGNLAIASGTVTSAEDPSLVGHPAIFVVQDNGQGASAAPDQVSNGVFVDRPVTCDTAPTALALSVLVPIDAGNVQIR